MKRYSLLVLTVGVALCLTIFALLLDFWLGLGGTPKMECVLVPQEINVISGDSPGAEVQFRNTSDVTIVVINHDRTSPLEFLDVEVLDPDGRRISDYFGHLCIPSVADGGTEHSFAPGETYRETISLFRAVDDRYNLKPGVYKVTAFFRYGDIRATSRQIEITVLPKIQ
jgi:hypothetical protein